MESFPLTLQDLLYGGVVPAIVAFVVALGISYLLPKAIGERHSAAMGALVGFLTAYALLELAPWTPDSHWHWLPYACITAAVVGAIAAADGISIFERTLVYLVVAGGAAWFLVPDWEDLDPSRNMHLLAFTAYVVVLASLLEPLFRRAAGPMPAAVVWLTLSATAVVGTLSGSLKFGQLSLAMAAALFGLFIASCIRRDRFFLQGSALLVSLVAVGSMLIAKTNSFSEVPLVSYALVPVAPLSLWLAKVWPLTKLQDSKRLVVRLIPIAVVLVITIAILATAVTLGVVAESADPYSDY